MAVSNKPLQAIAIHDETVRVYSGEISVDDFLAYYDTCFPQIYNYICYRCGDISLADDLTAAVFERALQNLRNYRSDRGSLIAWLFVIARTIVSNHFRQERRRPSTSLEHWQDHLDSEETPEDVFLQKETRQTLLAGLQKLDERERDLLGLKYGAHFTNRRIAEMTGLSETNVGVIVHRALNKLRFYMQTRDAQG